MNPRPLALVVFLGATSLLSSLHAQDMEAMRKWGAAVKKGGWTWTYTPTV